MSRRPWAKVWARGTRRIIREENTHLGFIQIQANPQSTVKIRNLTRRIQSRTLDLAVPTPSLIAPNRLLSTQLLLTNLTLLGIMWIGMRWTVRDILYYSVDFLSRESQEGIKAPPLSEELIRILGRTARWCLTRMPPSGFSAVENMGPLALSERIKRNLDYRDFELIGKRLWALSGCQLKE